MPKIPKPLRCGHMSSPDWSGCDTCLTELQDRRMLGRLDMHGVQLGVAMWINPRHEVIYQGFYVDLVTDDSGGSVDAWVGGGGEVIHKPDAVFAAPIEDCNVATEAVAEWLRVQTEIATRILPRLLDNGVDSTEDQVWEFAKWACSLDVPGCVQTQIILVGVEVAWLITQMEPQKRVKLLEWRQTLDEFDLERIYDVYPSSDRDQQ